MSRWLWTAELWTPGRSAGNISQESAGPLPAAAVREGQAPPLRHRTRFSLEAGLPDRLEERLQFLGPGWVAELPERLGFDLADPLAGHVEGAADLFQSVLGAVADAEPHLEDLFLPRGQGLEHPAGLVLEVGDQDRLDRRQHPPVLDEVPQVRILFLPDGRLERDRLLGDLHDLADLGDRHVHALGNLLGVGL